VTNNILTFPKNAETIKLLLEQHIDPTIFETPFLDNITKSISHIRKTHGSLTKTHIKPIIQLLEHDWLPSDIPILLPEPFIIKEN